MNSPWSKVRADAERYAAALVPGDKIIDEIDGPIIASFRHLLPACLARRGLMAEPCSGGFVIRTAPWAPKPPVVCEMCKASWFNCEHGVNLVVEVSKAEGPALVLKTARA